jgi:signal transduction histidine kinase
VDIESGVSITLEDTGIGIPRDLIETAFQDFRQLDQSYTRQEGGTGLGLSITRRLVGLLGGRLFVRSLPGVGSHFRVELPIFPGQAPRLADDVLVIEDGPVSTDPSVSSSARGA